MLHVMENGPRVNMAMFTRICTDNQTNKHYKFLHASPSIYRSLILFPCDEWLYSVVAKTLYRFYRKDVENGTFVFQWSNIFREATYNVALMGISIKGSHE